MKRFVNIFWFEVLLQNSCYIQNMAFGTQESHPYMVYKLHFATVHFCYYELQNVETQIFGNEKKI